MTSHLSGGVAASAHPAQNMAPDPYPPQNTIDMSILRLAHNHFPSQFCAQLQTNRECFSDMTISGGVEGDRMFSNAHRVMLAAHSKFLGSLLLDIGRSPECIGGSGGELSLIICDFSASVVSKLVELIYTGTCTLPSDHERIELATIMTTLGIQTEKKRDAATSAAVPQLSITVQQQLAQNGLATQRNGALLGTHTTQRDGVLLGTHTVEKPNTAANTNCSTTTLSQTKKTCVMQRVIGMHTSESREEMTSDMLTNGAFEMQQQPAIIEPLIMQSAAERKGNTNDIHTGERRDKTANSFHPNVQQQVVIEPLTTQHSDAGLVLNGPYGPAHLRKAPHIPMTTTTTTPSEMHNGENPSIHSVKNVNPSASKQNVNDATSASEPCQLPTIFRAHSEEKPASSPVRVILNVPMPVWTESHTNGSLHTTDEQIKTLPIAVGSKNIAEGRERVLEEDSVDIEEVSIDEDCIVLSESKSSHLPESACNVVVNNAFQT